MIDQSIIPTAPIHLFELVIWRTDYLSDQAQTYEVKYIYYRHCVWWDHPWGSDGDKGADFKDEWAVWTKYPGADFRPSGRVSGWRALIDGGYLSGPDVHLDRLSALRWLEKKLTAKINRLVQEVIDGQLDLARVHEMMDA